MEAVIRDDVSGKEATHEVSETATAGGLLEEACRLFKREVLDSALEVDGAVVCTGVVGGVSGGEVSVGSLGVHSDSRLVLCRSRDRVLAEAAEWNSWRVENDGDSLPEWAWDDEVVALALAEANTDSFMFVSKRLRSSDAFMRDVVVRVNCLALKYAGTELRSDREVVRIAVTEEGATLQYACDNLRDDKELVLAAVAQSGTSLEYASNRLRDDREVVCAAVAQRGLALRFASEGLQADKQVVLAAVGQDGAALDSASEGMRADKEVVLVAVAGKSQFSSPWAEALQYASETLRADREVVQVSVAQNGRTLRSASVELKGDKQIVLTAVAQDGAALRYVSEELRADDEVMAAARVLE